MNFPEKQIVVVCFGTPLVSGDALGPKVGTLLQNWNLPCFVYGTEDRPVTATNMKELLTIKDDYISKLAYKVAVVIEQAISCVLV